MIKVNELRKEFKDFQALRGLNMHVKAGEVYGFIGQNGAGKTTTINILAGLSHPTQGECIVNGKNVASISHPGDLGIGYLPEDPRFYPWMTAYETLVYMSGKHKSGKAREILGWTGLEEACDRKVGGFSRGMKQRLGLGVTLIQNPKLFILDEPSSALDPEGRGEVLRLIKDLKSMGKTILFSTHILDDVERVCDTVGMIDSGKMILEKPLGLLQKETAQLIFDITPSYEVETGIMDRLSQLKGIVSVKKAGSSFVVGVADSDISVLLMRFFADHEIQIESFSLRKTRLEDLFIQGVQIYEN